MTIKEKKNQSNEIIIYIQTNIHENIFHYLPISNVDKCDFESLVMKRQCAKNINIYICESHTLTTELSGSTANNTLQ